MDTSMAQHFLLTREAKDFSLVQVFRMSDAEVESMFRKLRWAETDGEPVCPHCGGLDAYDCRRPNGAPRFRCRACRGDFSVTSGTLFASHKLPLRMYLAAIAIFCNEVKGKSMLALSRDLGLSYKAAFVLAHKMREAMASEIKDQGVGADGEIVEIDAAYFGGYIRPENRKEDRVDRRILQHHTGKRKAVVVARERGGRAITGVFPSEAGSLGWIKSRVAKGAVINADESAAWNPLHSRYKMGRINHAEAYSTADACTNQAESYFARLRRSEIGHHHHIAGIYLANYAKESAWRENNRRVSNGGQVSRVMTLAMASKPSVDFSGYWQCRKLESTSAG
jgi:transposase-like protein